MTTSDATLSTRIEQMRRFKQFSELPDDLLAELSEKCEWLDANKSSVLIELGSDEKTTLFLLEGKVRLTAEDGGTKVISHQGHAARSPISRLRPSRYQVVAITPVKYLKFDNTILAEVYDVDEPSSLISSGYEVNESRQEDSDMQAQLLVNIYEDLNQDRLHMYSWRPLGLKVAEQILKERTSAARIAELLLMDPALAIKVIRASARQSLAGTPAQNCHDAVTRLGIQAVHRLTFLNLFTESVEPDSPILTKAYQANWQRSITVAAISRLLADNRDHENSDTVALAGLVHDIGELIILSYACNFPAPVEESDLKECIQMYAAEVGKVLLAHWGMPHGFVSMVAESRNWERDDPGQNIDTDIILMSRFYTELARKEHKGAHRASKLPAYNKLRLNETGGEALVDKIKETARSAVDETNSFLQATSG